MKSISRYFLIGLTILLPVVISIQILVWLVQTAESWLKPLWLTVLPQQLYFPGLALLSFVAIVVLIGYLSRNALIDKVLGMPGSLMERMPIVHQLYTILRDFFELLGGKNFDNNSVVWVNFPETKTRLLGLVTKDGKAGDSRLSSMMEDNEVAVFLPMSYQAGGYMIVVDRELLTETSLKPGEALSLIMSAGLGGRE